MATTKTTTLCWAPLAVLLWVCVDSSGAALPLPSVIKACSRNDPNINECATKNAMSIVPKLKNGIPEYGIPVLDPFYVKRIDVDNLGVHLDFKDVLLHGLTSNKVKGIKITLDPLNFRWKLFAPKVEMIGKYEASGRILVLPIVGKGNFNITLYGLDYTYEFNCDKVKKSDGEIYMSPKNNNIEYELESASLHFENLFNGNKLLGDEMNRFMNENWREVDKSIGPKVAESIATTLQVVAKGLASKVPMREFFPEKV